jgi:hypothetical protein
MHELEYDNCYNEGRAGTPHISYERYANMSRALNATGRPIFYSMCNWGEDGPWNFANVTTHLYYGHVNDADDYLCRLLPIAGVSRETLRM